MRTNPEENINAEWGIHSAVKPSHLNALTRAIPYDYVIQAEHLPEKTANIQTSAGDLPDLYELCGSPAKLEKGDVSILLCNSVGLSLSWTFGTGTFFYVNSGDFTAEGSVHIYTVCKNRGQYAFAVKAVTAAKADLCIHTAPENGAAVFVHGSVRAANSNLLAGYVYNPLAVTNTSTPGEFVYEGSSTSIGGNLPRRAWMSNTCNERIFHEAELVFDHSEGGDTPPTNIYHIKNCIDNAVNRVYIRNETATVCKIYVEAPEGGHGVYNYSIELICSDSTGYATVEVADASPALIRQPPSDPTDPPVYAADTTVSFSGGINEMICVRDSFWEIKRY